MGDVFIPEKLSWFVRTGFAQFVIGFLLILNLVNFAIPHAGDIRPLFLLMAIYYWAIFRPTLIPPVMAFAWGILFDMLAGLPVGMNALLFLIIQWVVRDQRLFLMGQSFMTLWLGFAVTALAYGIIQWLLFAVFSLSLPDYRPAAGTIVLSIGLFPLVSFLLVVTHRLLPQEMSRSLR